jgi:hypothetical protein
LQQLTTFTSSKELLMPDGYSPIFFCLQCRSCLHFMIVIYILVHTIIGYHVNHYSEWLIHYIIYYEFDIQRLFIYILQLVFNIFVFHLQVPIFLRPGSSPHSML